MITSMNIGNRIAEARKRKGISQAGLANQLSISAQAVGKWERGESMPDIITLTRLSEILGVDLNYFSGAVDAEATELLSDIPLVRQTDDLPSANPGKKLKWDMSRGNWVDADFSGLNNLHEKFSSSNMLRCKFIRSDLAGLHLMGNNISDCDFSGCDISGSHIQRSNLTNNLLKGCSLKETLFSESYISGCDFKGADFTGVVFKSGGITDVANRGEDPEKNVIAEAVWNRTSFKDMYISNMVITGTVEECSFETCAFKKVVFRNATLLNTFFKNKSLKGVRFIDCQADKMTYEFLKNGKADLSGITLIA